MWQVATYEFAWKYHNQNTTKTLINWILTEKLNDNSTGLVCLCYTCLIYEKNENTKRRTRKAI